MCKVECTCCVIMIVCEQVGAVDVMCECEASGMSAATASKEAVEAVGLLGVCVSGMSAATASIEAAEAVGLL